MLISLIVLSSLFQGYFDYKKRERLNLSYVVPKGWIGSYGIHSYMVNIMPEENNKSKKIADVTITLYRNSSKETSLEKYVNDELDQINKENIGKVFYKSSSPIHTELLNLPALEYEYGYISDDGGKNYAKMVYTKDNNSIYSMGYYSKYELKDKFFDEFNEVKNSLKIINYH